MTWTTTFHPDSDRKEADQLRAAFFAQRIGLALDSVKECERINRTVGLQSIGDELLELLARPTEASAAVFDDPVFAIWLRFLHRAAVNNRHQESLYHSASLPAVLARVEKRLTGGERLYVPGSMIAVQQGDIDPYLMAATPPSYDFMGAALAEADAATQGHPVGLQAELLGWALKAIGDAWPEMKEEVLEYIKIFGYLPDASFRSCSAARYSGVVYFGNMDESVLDIEESIVHETGHQVLYRLAEVEPLTKPGTPIEATYLLPWSGSKRDLFGFLHAFHIYVLLVKYFARRSVLEDHMAEECRLRAGLILLGLLIARPSLEGDANLTEQGHRLVGELCQDIDKLRETVRIPAATNGEARV